MRTLNRLTGISTPVFGVSWNPSQLDVDVARRLLTSLEDRRMLFAPEAWRHPAYVVGSVYEVRVELTKVLNQVSHDVGRETPVGEGALAMRAACRKFLTRIGPAGFQPRNARADDAPFDTVELETLMTALGELRAVFGIHIARISVAYGIDVEEGLASILPEEADEAD